MTDEANKMPQANPPRVFISYSHDSVQHKEWVSGLAGKLRGKGIDVILDQWDISLGSDLSHFMEYGLTTADRVLVVCTPTYCKKANDGKGGVGYEKLIVTQGLISNTQTDKFVPVIRVAEGDPRSVVPTCLGARLFIDMREGQPDNFEDLVGDIHRQPPANKPPMGKYPYAQTATGASIAATSASVLTLPIVATSLDPIAVYDQAIQIARAKDFIGWRHLARDVRNKALAALIACRVKLDSLVESGVIQRESDISTLLDAGMGAVAPMFAMALAGVESGVPEIERQEAVLDEVINVAGWNSAGYDLITRFPINLGFMYHYLHGAMAMQIGRLDLAMGLSLSPIADPRTGEPEVVCECHDLMGWTPIFRSHVTHSWRYLQGYVKNSPWLQNCFGSASDLLTGVAAYGYALTLNELSRCMQRALAQDQNWKPSPDDFSDLRPTIPLFFAVDEEPVPQRGYQLFLRVRGSIPSIWQRYSVPDVLMPGAWEAWMKGSSAWLTKLNYHRFLFGDSGLPHARLLVDLGLTATPPRLGR